MPGDVFRTRTWPMASGLSVPISCGPSSHCKAMTRTSPMMYPPTEVEALLLRVPTLGKESVTMLSSIWTWVNRRGWLTLESTAWPTKSHMLFDTWVQTQTVHEVQWVQSPSISKPFFGYFMWDIFDLKRHANEKMTLSPKKFLEKNVFFRKSNLTNLKYSHTNACNFKFQS